MTSWLIFKPVSLAYFLAGGNSGEQLEQGVEPAGNTP
jgi:hypothetical protein